MAPKKRKISSLIESQLPGFINNDYENFSKFIEKYYEQQESVGQPIDIISNLEKYKNIDFYEKDILEQSTTLAQNISADDDTVVLSNGNSFPEENGYIKIGEEILFYQNRSGNTLEHVSRGVSGNTTLGNLYHESRFVTTASMPHTNGDVVHNISNLFLYALVKQFERTYLSSFPESYLKEDIDKRTLIKNISKFYKTKGTDKSIKFIFNTLISKGQDETVETYAPEEFVFKSSTSDWSQDYIVTAVVQGDPSTLVGELITQEPDLGDPSVGFASAVVDNVRPAGVSNGDSIYEVILEPTTINGVFNISGKTTLLEDISITDESGDRITVSSTLGFPDAGKLSIGAETFSYKKKTVNQFIIDGRFGTPRNHAKGKSVYSNVKAKTAEGASITIFGSVYGVSPTVQAPYTKVGETLEVSDAGFESIHPAIYCRKYGDAYLDHYKRWLINTDPSTNKTYENGVAKPWVSDVSNVYEDDQYFYIASSGYPTTASNDAILKNTPSAGAELTDQESLKIIRKYPSTITEIYQTPNRDVGIFMDGVPAVSYRDTENVVYGRVETTTVNNKGFGYERAPFVLVNETRNKARAVMSGSTVDSIEFLSNEIYETDPVVRITSGEGGKLKAVVTKDEITSLEIVDPGNYYSSPPLITIIDQLGKGSFAQYEAIVNSDGQIVDTKKINGGKFYSRGNVIIAVTPVGRNASGTANVKRWVFDRYKRLSNARQVDDRYGVLFESFNGVRATGYGYLSAPYQLREQLQDDNYLFVNDGSVETNNPAGPQTHSPILGFAYDGNPIYGPYGYTDPMSMNSSISRMSSGYQIKPSRSGGPSVGLYPLGTFIDDYQWVPSTASEKTELDANNGRFCVTPDYPEGVYAYFVTFDSSLNPQFPYILGENFYSLPVESNYNSPISQTDIPENVRSLRTSLSENNGAGFLAQVETIKAGDVNSGYIEASRNYHSPGNKLHIDSTGTGGIDIDYSVNEVKGKNIVAIDSKDTRAVKVTLQDNAYLFNDDVLTLFDEEQVSLGEGTIVGNVLNDIEVVLRNVLNTFEVGEYTVTSESLVQNLIVDRTSSYTVGAKIILTNDNDDIVASGTILETVEKKNSVKVVADKTTGLAFDWQEFFVTGDYYLRSFDLGDTNRAEIISVQDLSRNLRIRTIDENLAIVETETNHQLGVGDEVDISFFPDDDNTTTTYYTRKRLYQKGIVLNPLHQSTITDTGIGSADVLNSGDDYEIGTFENVELIFVDSSEARPNIGRTGDANNARATIIVSSPSGFTRGGVTSIILPDKGANYRKGDRLTVLDEDLNRDPGSTSAQRLILEVDHVGFEASNTVLRLNTVSNLSQGDKIQIAEEIAEITLVDVQKKTVTVTRGVDGTPVLNHVNGQEVTLKDGFYRFDNQFKPFGEGAINPTLINYDASTEELFVAYEYGVENPRKITFNTTFFDSSIPAKLVQFRTVEDAEFNLEFSLSGDAGTFTVNPIIDIQKYYKYDFDVSHYSMNGTYLDFSSSINQNIFTGEKTVTQTAPGNPGARVSIKLGFGPLTSSNNFTVAQDLNFQNYFYFIKASSDVNTRGSYLRVIDSPLSGRKKISYVTDTRFVYQVDYAPQYDVTETNHYSKQYTTSSLSAVGEIHTLRVINTGRNYTSLPIVKGVSVNATDRADVELLWDEINSEVIGYNIKYAGNNYSAPLAVLTTENSVYYIPATQTNGNLNSIILTTGIQFDARPEIEVIETDCTIYLGSDNIGIPKSISIKNPGKAFNNDKTQRSSINTKTTFVLRNLSDKYYQEEIICQDSTGAEAVVSVNGYREGSNLLRVESITGVFRTGDPIKSKNDPNRTATLYAQLSTDFDSDVRYYVDNFGRFNSDKGKSSNVFGKLQDSFFYQNYSYVVKSKTPIDVWRDLIKETTHPAGFKLFGEMIVDSQSELKMPKKQSVSTHNSEIVLPPVQIYPADQKDLKKYVSVVSVSVSDLTVEQGLGSVSIDTFDSSETRTFNIELGAPFDGKLDPSTGQLVGTKIFDLLDKATGNALTFNKAQNLLVTLDGIFQEPGVAYEINGNQIIFAAPPLGERIVEGQKVDGVKFYGRSINFKNPALNTRFFRKIRSFADQFNGRKTEFELYWDDDGSIVKTEPKELLMVGLNGVIQKPRVTETAPYGNSYSIIRSEEENVPDIIRFTKPPIDQEDSYEEESIPEELRNYEKCFIYSIGEYEVLTVDKQLYEYRGSGPYLIQDVITNRVRKIDNSTYAFVFIDGVLQREFDSYEIDGPNIKFSEPLRKEINETGFVEYQDVHIILLFGRDIPRTLTFYDFEQSAYLNTIYIDVQGDGVADAYFERKLQIESESSYYYVTQGGKSLGKPIREVRIDSDNLALTVQTESNVSLSSTDPIGFFIYETPHAYDFSYEQRSLTVPGDYTVSYTFKTNDDNERIVEKTYPSWLYGTELADKAWENRNSLLANLLEGDLILIDGESEYRSVLETPKTAKIKSYREGDSVSANMYSTIEVSEYFGETYGVGLSLKANVNQFGTVVDLNVADIEWNQRDLKIFLEGGPLLQPTAYDYFTTPIVHFIPVDGNGGGARAEVIVYGGQVLDVVLTDGGSGYTQPPKVVIARKYKRIKKNARKIDTFRTLSLGPSLAIGTVLTTEAEITIQGDGSTSQFFSIVSFGGFTDAEADRKIIAGIQPDPDLIENALVTRIDPGRFKDGANVGITRRPTVQVQTFFLNSESVITEILNAGVQAVTMLDSNVSRKITTSVVNDLHEDFTVEHDTRSVSGIGAYLDGPVDLDDDILFVTNTDGFPDTPSRLRINGEVVYYQKKSKTRFIDVTRGYQDTIPATHQAGDLVLSDPEYVTLLSVAVNEVYSFSSFGEIKADRVIEAEINITTDVTFDADNVSTEEFIRRESPLDQIATFEQDTREIQIISMMPILETDNSALRHSSTVVSVGIQPTIETESTLLAGASDDRVIKITSEIQHIRNTSINNHFSVINDIAPLAFTSANVVTTSLQQNRYITHNQIQTLNTLRSTSVEVLEAEIQPDIKSSYAYVATVKRLDVRASKGFTSITEPEPFDPVSHSEVSTVVAGITEHLLGSTVRVSEERYIRYEYEIAREADSTITATHTDINDIVVGAAMNTNIDTKVMSLDHHPQPTYLGIRKLLSPTVSHHQTRLTEFVDVKIENVSPPKVNRDKTIHRPTVLIRAY